jgi:hypothetical protein
MASTNSVVFHFDKAYAPNRILHVLKVLQNAEKPFVSGTLWEQMAREQSFDDYRFGEARKIAQQLGLVEEITHDHFHLTPLACGLLTKRDAVQYDLLHALFYTAWKSETPSEFGRSWFYRSFCNTLWSEQHLKLDRATRLTLTEQLLHEAQTCFQHVPNFSSEKLSVSIKSMDGAQEWLSQLQPAVLKQESKRLLEFKPRQACSTELFLFALSHSYMASNAETGVDLLLSPQRRDEICRLCLLDSLQFDRMLDWTLPLFPQYISQGTRAGSYGRFVRLKQLVQVDDLVQGVVVMRPERTMP